MSTSIRLFEYDGQTVEFDFSHESIMVNATEMAKIFNRDVKDFNKLESTKSFINICLNGEFSSPLGLKKLQDLIITRPRSGTWMHRVLALKFAAWLEPRFELWVYTTIDSIMFGSLREDAKLKAKLKAEREAIIERLMDNEDYKSLMNLDAKDKEVKNKINKQIKNQLHLFS